MGFQPKQQDISDILTAVQAIQAKTDNLSSDPATESNVTAVGVIAAAVQTKTDNLPDDPADESSIQGAISSSQTAVTDEIQKAVSPIQFWSDVEDQIALTQASGNFNLPDVVVSGIPSGVSLIRVVAIIKIRAIENTSASGANAINGATQIKVKKSTGTWGVDDVIAINLADDMWNVAASTRESGDVVIGDNDVKSTVDEDATYNLRFDTTAVDYNNLQLNDILVGLIFYFTTS